MFSFYKFPKPQSFHFKPRYYDERKERIANVTLRAKKELGMLESGEYSVNYKSTLDFKRSHFRSTGIIRFVVFAVLVVISVLYLRGGDTNKADQKTTQTVTVEVAK